TGTAVHIPGDDLDTDRIIPARFMKCVTFDCLGEFMFYDVRNDPTTGKKTDHNLNDPSFAGASIIETVAGTGNKEYSGDGGSALEADLNRPFGLGFDLEGNMYISDTFNGRIRKVKMN
ncbi:MAG: hypothetical protein ACKVT0_12740, partial [Planctomycetaceae bacterium]